MKPAQERYLRRLKAQVDLRPHDLDCKLEYARGLYHCGCFAEAESVLLDMIRATPESPAVYRALADVERARGQCHRAALSLEQLLILEPGDAKAWNQLAAMRSALADWEDAVDAYRRARNLGCKDPSTLVGLALALLSLQRLDEARRVAHQLTVEYPTNPQTPLVNGHIFKSLGEFDKAIDAYLSALRLDHNLSEAIYNLVELEPPAPTSAIAQRIKSLSESGKLGLPDKANVEFALARIYESARQFETAFEYYVSANAAVAAEMRTRGLVYDTGHMARCVQKTISDYPDNGDRQIADPVAIELKLIFIVGLPRSGTTLVEQILCSHPQVAAGGELTLASGCERDYRQRRNDLGLSGPVDRADEREVELLQDMRDRYLDGLIERDLCDGFVTDKLPGNFEILGFVRRLFPDATIIHCRRDPIAVCWSLFTANFGLHDPYYNSLDNIAHYYTCYEQLMSHWHQVLRPSPVDMRYEVLVHRPAETIQQLLAGCGLPWDDRCLAFHENRRPVFTASSHQVRKPIYTTSVDRWRHYEKQLEELRRHIDRSLP